MAREPTGPAPPSPPLDEGTLRRVRERDEAAMNRFFDAFFDRVFAYVTRLVRDGTVAEDLTQDSFVRMHGALDRLDPTRDPTPWVFTVVTNTVRDHWRSRAYRATLRQSSLEDLGDLPSDDGQGAPDRALERKESARAVRAAMGRLSAADREILLLRDFRSLTTEEIVEILGIRPEAVRQRHSRAVRRLGRAYRELRGGQNPATA